VSETAYELLQKGKELMKNGHPAQAAHVLERAKKLYPEKASIRELLGQAYYNYGEYSKAKDEFEKTVEIDPSNHYAHFGLGLSLNRLGEKLGALRHIKLALAMEPNSEDYALALYKVSGRRSLRAKRKKAPIKVRSYAGYKGSQVPRAFTVGVEKHLVARVEKTWREEAKGKMRKHFFRILTKEGFLFDICYDETLDEWWLEKEF